MKRGRLQAKDIPDSHILNVLADYQGQWAFMNGNGFEFDSNPEGKWPIKKGEWVRVDILPEDFPRKLFMAKLRSLHKRKLIGGCTCGCRGDFEITDKGLELIGRERTKPYSGY